MESDDIINIVSQVPTLFGAYIRVIIVYEDRTTRAKFQEDLGPKSARWIEKCLTGILFVADSSQRKKAVQKHLFQLVGKIRKKEWALENNQATKLTRNFGFFQQNIKGMMLEEGRKVKYERMHHVVGKHSAFGDWCRGK